MGEWEQGLEAARKQGIIDDSTHDRLAKMSFERQATESKFPMRIALIVLGAILLVSAGFAIFVRILGDDPSQVFVAAIIALVALVFEIIARVVLRAKPLNFLAGVIGSFAGVPLGFAVALFLPGDPEVGSGAVGAFVAAVWSWLWFRRTKSGVAIAAVVLELALLVMLLGESSNFSIETTGVVLCVLGVVVALASIIGRLKPSLPPLVASLIVVGWGCIAQNTYGGDVIAVIGIAISAILFLVAYRRSQALMSAATAVSTGMWAVVLTAALTEGSLVPLIVEAALGAAMIAWGAKLTRK
ncbi:MAG: hypothetical protein ABR56_02490 [Acidimicrobium sp. BACL27 MAG-120823-bin4]|jgi:hypothetical protein|nr:MAG: hypothetical protein ABR56_02490 [Acidimicrobium sp. BACL27 MAG-120823-bin4]